MNKRPNRRIRNRHSPNSLISSERMRMLAEVEEVQFTRMKMMMKRISAWQ
jgi:hypothetical protein